MRTTELAAIQTPPTSSVGVRAEVGALALRLDEAERRHQEARDHYRKQTQLLADGRRANVEGALRGIEQMAALVAGIGGQLESKKLELVAIEKAEADAAAIHQHDQSVLSLREIENDCQTAKATLDALKAQYAQLPSQIQAAEWRFGQLLWGRNEARKQLGLG